MKVLLILVFVSSVAFANDGRVVFENNCAGCHNIKSLNIVDEVSGPDLSDTGDKHTTEFLSLYLQKKESIKGQKHRIRFREKKSKRKALIKWLESLKFKK